MSGNWNSNRRFGYNGSSYGKGGYGSRKSGGAPTVNVYQGQGQRQAPPPQQQAPPPPDPEREALNRAIKEKRDDLWRKMFTLVTLCGAKPVPLCFAQGRALITDYAVWKKYHDDVLWKFAKSSVIAEEQSDDGNGSVFTWGVRPIDARYAKDLRSQEAVGWVWGFIMANIAPYPAAMKNFRDGMMTLVAETGGEFPEEAAAMILELAAGGQNLTSDVARVLPGLLEFKYHLTPGEIKDAYTLEAQPGNAGTCALANLKLLQTVGAMEQRQEVLQNRISSVRGSITQDFLSSDTSTAASRAASPQRRPVAPTSLPMQ